MSDSLALSGRDNSRLGSLRTISSTLVRQKVLTVRSGRVNRPTQIPFFDALRYGVEYPFLIQHLRQFGVLGKCRYQVFGPSGVFPFPP